MELFDHQKKIIDENKSKVGLFLGTGSGKTRTALLLARGNTLIICPKTQKEDKNWEREVEKLNLDLRITVKSKEEFRKIASTWFAHFDTIIVDEAHTCLGVTPAIKWVEKVAYPKTSQLFEELAKFVERTQPDRLYLVTATPTRNPMCVWGAGRLLGKNWNFYEWRQTFYHQLNIPRREIWVPKNDNITKDRLAKSVQSIGYVGRLEDYFDVPDQIYRTVYVDLTTEQKKRIKELPMEYPDPLVLLGKKHQVENGSLKGNEFSDGEYFNNEKIEKIKDFAIEFPKMIVFAKYTAQIIQIGQEMTDMGKKIFILTGSTVDRGSLLSEASKCDNYVFICQSQVSAGWELPNCPVMIYASMSYSITDRIQSEGRIHRANNLKKNLYITLVTRGGIDEAVYKSIENKKDFSERIYLKS